MHAADTSKLPPMQLAGSSTNAVLLVEQMQNSQRKK